MAMPGSRTRALNAQKVAKLLEAAQRRPELPSLRWAEDDACFDGQPFRMAPAPDGGTQPVQPAVVESDPRTYGPQRRRIRDRYISVRFAGVARSAADLENPTRVVKAARLAFEEDHPDSALELLELAIEQNAREPALWLADLEIAYLIRDAAHFVRAARAFHAAFPTSAEWNEIARLGSALDPGEALFGAKQGPRSHEHYGPWPHTPNWIQAPWDLTSEVMAADFHRAMTAAPEGRVL